MPRWWRDCRQAPPTSRTCPSERLADVVGRDIVQFTCDEVALADADVLIVAVPSPLTRDRQPNLSHIMAAAATIERVLRPGQLVSLESTTYPGTTDDLFAPMVERRGLVLDEDVFVCFSPERVDPGNVLLTADIPKVVGGVTQTSGAIGATAYSRMVSSVHVVSTARAAELTKLLENTYRAVNIALVNELTQFAAAVDIDIWEVVDAAATKPFGFQAFYPGPGVGGHCIPLDPQFLAWRAREAHTATRFIDLAEEVNLHMPAYTADRVAACSRATRSLSPGPMSSPSGLRTSPTSATTESLRHGTCWRCWPPAVPPSQSSIRMSTQAASARAASSPSMSSLTVATTSRSS